MFIRQKKITALGLLLLVALPLFFSVGILVKQKIIQFHRRARFEKEVLQTISIPVEKIYWVKPGKEILVDGNLFDVKSYRTEGEKISLTGFFDDKEDELVKDIKDIIHEKKESNNPSGRVAVKFLIVPVYADPLSLFLQDTWQIVDREFSIYTEIIHKGSHPDHNTTS